MIGHEVNEVNELYCRLTCVFGWCKLSSASKILGLRTVDY